MWLRVKRKSWGQHSLRAVWAGVYWRGSISCGGTDRCRIIGNAARVQSHISIWRSAGQNEQYRSHVAPSLCFQACDGKFVLNCGSKSSRECLCCQTLNCWSLLKSHGIPITCIVWRITTSWFVSLSGRAADKSIADCIRECSDAGLPCAPVWDFKQAYSSSFYREERRMFITVPTPDGATADAMVQPIVFGSHPRRLRFSAAIWPTHRQNTPSKAGYPAEHNRRLSPHGCYQIICSIRYR